MTTVDSARPVLTVKQLIPPVRDGAVPRERLAALLDTAETRLTVIVAPAGWGKTSLLSAWAHQQQAQQRVAWVSLDANDDEPRRFWRYLLTALNDASDDIGNAALEALSAEIPVVDLALPVLLNELAESTTPHLLVLDDYHCLTDPHIHESLEFLITYSPPSLRVVIASRADPELPLARLRARGDLTEIRAAQLRFSPDEAAALVSAVSGIDLDSENSESIWRHTEGWPAGLQLAALALRADPRRPHDDRHLLDYFSAEVLPGLAAPQRDLLVRSAPLELLSGPLCDAALTVTGPRRYWRSWSEPTCSWPHSTENISGTDATACFATPCSTSPELTPRVSWSAPHHGSLTRTGSTTRSATSSGAGCADTASELLLEHAESWFLAEVRHPSSSNWVSAFHQPASGPLLPTLLPTLQRSAGTAIGWFAGLTVARPPAHPTPSRQAGIVLRPRCCACAQILGSWTPTARELSNWRNVGFNWRPKAAAMATQHPAGDWEPHWPGADASRTRLPRCGRFGTGHDESPGRPGSCCLWPARWS